MHRQADKAQAKKASGLWRHGLALLPGTSFLLSSQALPARDLMLANGSVYTLDRNLFDLEARGISDTEVLATLFEGAVVFGTLA